MQDLMKPCIKCGGTEKFLRQKGNNQIGLYCMQCEAWFKWVGKKTLIEYARRGFRVHAESWVAPSVQVSTSVPVQQAPVHDRPTQQSTQYTPNVATDRGYGDTQFPPTRLSSNDLGVKASVGSTSDVPFDIDDYYTPSEEGVKPSNTPVEEDEPCEFCITRSMKAIHNDPFKLSIMGALASVSDLAGTKRFGTFKFKYCPSCGQKLKV